MIRLASDENFNNDVIRGLRRRVSGIDVVRIQDVSLRGASDPVVLDWAAREGRTLLTHDASTLTSFAYARVAAGLPMPGVIQITRNVPISSAIDDILLLVECSSNGEWEGQVLYLPL